MTEGPVTSDFVRYHAFWMPWIKLAVVWAAWVAGCLGVLAWKALR